MKMPGFTAEASLYQSTVYQTVAPATADIPRSASIQPQYSFRTFKCEPCKEGWRHCIYAVSQCGYNIEHCGKDSVIPNFCCWLNYSYVSKQCFQPTFGIG
jgi:hypothetical protein